MTGRLKESAGLLIYRQRNDRWEVLLAHPGGPFWRKRDLGAWTIPKGEIDPGEEPLLAARREFEEETGWRPEGPFEALPSIRQRGGKVVHAWAGRGSFDPATLRSNSFTLEWPPRSGREREFPEIDRVEYFSLAEARERILPSQLPLLDTLEGILKG